MITNEPTPSLASAMLALADAMTHLGRCAGLPELGECAERLRDAAGSNDQPLPSTD